MVNSLLLPSFEGRQLDDRRVAAHLSRDSRCQHSVGADPFCESASHRTRASTERVLAQPRPRRVPAAEPPESRITQAICPTRLATAIKPAQQSLTVYQMRLTRTLTIDSSRSLWYPGTCWLFDHYRSVPDNPRCVCPAGHRSTEHGGIQTVSCCPAPARQRFRSGCDGSSRSKTESSSVSPEQATWCQSRGSI